MRSDVQILLIQKIRLNTPVRVSRPTIKMIAIIQSNIFIRLSFYFYDSTPGFLSKKRSRGAVISLL